MPPGFGKGGRDLWLAISVPVLQEKTRHREIQATMRQVETARETKRAAEKVCVPDFHRRKVDGMSFECVWAVAVS